MTIKKNQNFRKKGRQTKTKKGNSEIGAHLRHLRIAQGWTVIEAGEQSNISSRVIAKLEKGDLSTSITNLESYLNFYGLTLTYRQQVLEETKKAEETSPDKVELDEKGLPKW